MRETDIDRQSVLCVGIKRRCLRHPARVKRNALVRNSGGRGGVESLDTAVATALALAEMAPVAGPVAGPQRRG